MSLARQELEGSTGDINRKLRFLGRSESAPLLSIPLEVIPTQHLFNDRTRAAEIAALIPKIDRSKYIDPKLMTKEMTSQQVGAGSFARIYKATATAKEIAIKVCDVTTDSFLFVLNEIFVLQKLSGRSPYIPHYYGYSELGKEQYIFMEYLPNGTLAQRIDDVAAQYKYPWKDRYAWLRGISAGIKFMHDDGIQHRDIKDANIIFNAKDEPVLCDFGFSGEYCQTIKKQGTMDWIAPEVLRGAVFENSADIFSLACIVAQLVTWSLPYPCIECTEVEEEKLAGKLPTLPDNCLPKIGLLFHWGSREDPTQRATATMFCEELTTDIDTISERLRENGKPAPRRS